MVACNDVDVEESPKHDEDLPSSPTTPVEHDVQSCSNNCVACMSNITFSDKNLLLGSTPHNRPLFIAGYAREQRINRMLLDGGSVVNILPLRAMKELSVTMEELSPSHLMIQGFNQGGQRAIGVLRLDLLIDDMTSSALFHVIVAKTSYNMLLGWPWLHKNGVVPSTLHQCFKYCRNGIVKKDVTDDKPFTEAESYFADAKFYLANIVVKELQHVVSSSTCKSQKDNEVQIGEDLAPTNKKKEANKSKKILIDDEEKKTISKAPPILWYVPKLKKSEDQALKGLTLLVTNLNQTKLSTPLKGFMRPTQSPEVEYGNLPSQRTE